LTSWIYPPKRTGALSCLASFNHDLLLIGGSRAEKKIQIYDTKENNWTNIFDGNSLRFSKEA
jgi:hypothetical protein